VILIDSLYVNEGGAKILLDYLVQYIEKSKLDVFYLFDARCKDYYQEIPLNRKCYLKASFFERYKFYKKDKYRFEKVLCFGNLPPNIRLKATVYTYFHNLLYLDFHEEFEINGQLKFRLKIIILKLIAKNTNYWIVQSNLVKDKLHLKFGFDSENILSLPFYPKFGLVDLPIRQRFTYLYVSNANPHKNHSRLINVFCRFYDTYKKGKLIVTVNQDYQKILDLIEVKQKLGYPIKNIGFVGRDELQIEYLSTEFLIFPSLTESFGLGLIEAIESGCKIIGTDLPYTFEVCQPSIVFNPLDNDSLFKAFETSLDANVKVSLPKIKNNIKELITILNYTPCN
jgi:glycosyltransferase involved in cell wall biosynthesis